MNPILIGLTGRAGSGKDTVATMIERHLDFAVHRYALATPLKQALCAMFGWKFEMWENREWKETVIPEIGFSPRVLAQTLGTEWGRNLAPDFWLRRAQMEWEQFKRHQPETGDHLMVITDVRFENEAAWLRDQGGVLVHVQRPGAETVNAHVSESGVTVLDGDYVLDNGADLDVLEALTLRLLREIL